MPTVLHSSAGTALFADAVGCRYFQEVSILHKPGTAWGTLVLVALLFVAWHSLGLPHWLFLVTGAIALVALLATAGPANGDRSCPACQVYSGRAYAARMSRSMPMRRKGDRTPIRRWIQPNRVTGWSETSYRCGACNHEWQERVDSPPVERH